MTTMTKEYNKLTSQEFGTATGFLMRNMSDYIKRKLTIQEVGEELAKAIGRERPLTENHIKSLNKAVQIVTGETLNFAPLRATKKADREKIQALQLAVKFLYKELNLPLTEELD